MPIAEGSIWQHTMTDLVTSLTSPPYTYPAFHVSFPSNFQDVVRQVVCPLHVEGGIVVICQGWPCWLTAALALGLPVVDVFCPQYYHRLFLSAGLNLENVVFHNLVIF